MENKTVKEILELISNSQYVLSSEEEGVVSVAKVFADAGADLPARESLELENLFEKIKRNGMLK